MGPIRAIWSIQDRNALEADEEKDVGLKREMVAGQERMVWNPVLPLPAKECILRPGSRTHQGGEHRCSTRCSLLNLNVNEIAGRVP